MLQNRKLFMKHFFSIAFFSLLMLNIAEAQELIIGSEYVKPGIRFIFEGAIKDDVKPYDMHLPESDTDVHIEARVNWESDPDLEVPEGAVRGGFIPYLFVRAVVTNEKTGAIADVMLSPHINNIDNFHYARNMKLPGGIDELYSVAFYLSPPGSHELSTHLDWRSAYGEQLMQPVTFRYSGVDFEEIAKASRR